VGGLKPPTHQVLAPFTATVVKIAHRVRRTERFMIAPRWQGFCRTRWSAEWPGKEERQLLADLDPCLVQCAFEKLGVGAGADHDRIGVRDGSDVGSLRECLSVHNHFDGG
jgi:hypothetical protein